ncbi:helical backbone metal receptor [Alteribacillus sp. HJP-4]|uniref:helical backbone metal receptor n=1 Tax=Alteribacillus sp. HJP-4 TaxID=2775394 RepID=UPI0035CD01E3
MNKWLKGISTASLAVVLSACGASGDNETAEDDKNEGGTEEVFATITDASGEEVEIEEEPERIVSLIPSNTEIAYSLGLEDRIVGVTDYCNFPEEASEKQSIGGLDFDLEILLSLEPDLVLAQASSAHSNEEAFDQIEESGAEILIVNDANSFEEAYDSMNMIGEATGTEEEAGAIIEEMEEDISVVEEKAEEIDEEERKSVWVEIQPPPEIYTTGQNTFMHEMLETINADNAAGDEEGWIAYSEEEAVAFNPDVILTTHGDYSDESIEEILERDGWEDVPAIQDEEIYNLNNDAVSRPGPRLVEGIEEIAESVYPNVFAEE